MKIESTINISHQNIELIEKSRIKLKISKNELITLLISQVINEKKRKFKGFKRIKYQKRNSSRKYKAIHISWIPDLYEKCIDLRKYYKMSVSYILSIALKKYLSKIMQQKHNYTINFKNYFLLTRIINNIPVFIITWDYIDENNMIKLLE